MLNIYHLEHVARTCGGVVKQKLAAGVNAQNKAETIGAHFVTEADHDSQELGLHMLRIEDRQEILIAEENNPTGVVPPYCTVFDPLDGTVGAFNGTTHYGVTLCTLRDGRPSAGVMYWPAENVLVSAVRGKGCWRNGFQRGQRLTIPPWHGQRDKLLAATDIGQWTDWAVLEAIGSKHNVVSYMAGIYGARAVIEGIAAFYWSLNIAKIWDVAAGALCVVEAGGVAGSPSNTELVYNSLNMDWFYARDREMADYLVPHFAGWKSPR